MFDPEDNKRTVARRSLLDIASKRRQRRAVRSVARCGASRTCRSRRRRELLNRLATAVKPQMAQSGTIKQPRSKSNEKRQGGPALTFRLVQAR